jgi:hypothetical protein
MDVDRNDEALSAWMLSLECNVDTATPQPVPSPSVSWFKDGQLVSSTLLGDSTMIEESFLTQNPILIPGVFNITIQFLLEYSSSTTAMYLSTVFTNITNPMLGNLTPDTTLEQARQLLFDTFLGNWTCFVNNSVGSASVEYILRERDNMSKWLLLFYLTSY